MTAMARDLGDHPIPSFFRFPLTTYRLVCIISSIMPASAKTRAPEATRHKILMAAFAEFYRHGFQGGSLNHIVEAAGATKGALFHHFAGKQELGYAVLDEITGPILHQRWLAPLANSHDPIAEMKRLFRQFVKEDIESGHFVQGCPLNNMAQEMSPLDEGFRRRIDRLYASWRKCYADALAQGIKSGKVRKNVKPEDAAALIVAAQMGIWGTGKSSRSRELMAQAGEAVCAYLDSLKP
jgi:TetR/AcrR family transcriptional regulator, transcriptional repressor for nem operon